MSSHELHRVEVLSRVKSKQLKLKDAAALLGVCYRQAKRLWKRYRSGGAKALKHGNAGRESNRAKPEKFGRQVLRVVRRKYSGAVGERFGPTLAAEHLIEEDGLAIDAETLRRWMLAEGLRSRVRKRKPYLQRRERRAHFGELVQLDGSFHEFSVLLATGTLSILLYGSHGSGRGRTEIRHSSRRPLLEGSAHWG